MKVRTYARTYYSVRCYDLFDSEDICRVHFRNLENAMCVYKEISSTMEFESVQLVKCEGRKEVVISKTTREEEMYYATM